MLHYGFLIDITANNYKLPRSLKGVYIHTWHVVTVAQPGFHFGSVIASKAGPLVCGPPPNFHNLSIFHTHPAERAPDINVGGGTADPLTPLAAPLLEVVGVLYKPLATKRQIIENHR